MPCKVVIVDYGTGNLSSVKRALARVGSEGLVSSEVADIAGSDKLILAGIGHFERAMAGLRQKPGLIDALEKAVLVDKKPVLGICLGMEVMANTSEEGDTRGLGWLEADVVRFQITDKLKYKIPNIGWNQVVSKKESPLTMELSDTAEFYFLHSYYLRLRNRADLLSEAEYETPFPAAVQKGSIFGVQFHPEKSHKAGLQLFRNFVEL